MSKKIHELGTPIIACETYIIHNEKVLMHKRPEDKKKFPGFWIGPGGHVDEGEDVLGAAIREAKEETGVDIGESNMKLKVLALHQHLDRKEVWVEYLFRTVLDKKQVPQNTGEGHAEWIDLKKVLTMDKIFPPAKYYLDHILNDKQGILYTFIQWENAQLVSVKSERLGS